MITLESFVVLEKLLVHNIRIEKKKIKADYTIHTFDGRKDSTEFIYTYEKPYFDIYNPHDVNLACMILAQIALNYGLFFRTIEFDGLFDDTDKSFLSYMMENTSREILTNKLLIRNEFIKAPFNQLKAEKRKRYTQSEMIFVNNSFDGMKVKNEASDVDNNKFAILSSGGKDSLLTYGIIKEIGEPFPIFINEAGRHWFTAVNAYRYFRENIPNTEKPWCSSDRVFNWMLRHFPFIKENYASIRADIYPLRLWTVAVFLFGALPVARKNKTGNILIGDEYDTSIKANIDSITHYAGLYDQSRYFDNALTRYYSAKGWNIKQYSILRSLSELLIMKVLIKRYPYLQRHQVSCHAAHERDGRMYPCGNCEKCRRIIGMMMALDEDPGNCGYNAHQITHALKSLETLSVKQIGSDVAHLYHLLMRKSLIARNEHTKRLAKEHPEITCLRFDKGRSIAEEIPVSIRKHVFDIFTKYADGAMERMKNKWVKVIPDEQ